MYNFDNISEEGLRNVLDIQSSHFNRNELELIAEKRLESGELDELELILEQNAE